MKIRFATFLFAGKVASLPLFADKSLGSIQKIQNNFFSNTSNIVGDHVSLDIKSPTNVSSTLKQEDSIILLNKSQQTKPCTLLDLVLTGLKAKDEVLVAISRDKDSPSSQKISPRLRLGMQDLTTLASFCVIGTTNLNKSHQTNSLNHTLSSESDSVMSIPIDLSSIYESLTTGSTFYLQVLVAPNSNWSWPAVSFSDLLQIRSPKEPVMLSAYGDITEDCTSYSCS